MQKNSLRKRVLKIERETLVVEEDQKKTIVRCQLKGANFRKIRNLGAGFISRKRTSESCWLAPVLLFDENVVIPLLVGTDFRKLLGLYSNFNNYYCTLIVQHLKFNKQLKCGNLE